MILTVTKLVADQGSLVLFQGIEHETDHVYLFAVDHRMAPDIVNAIEEGEDADVLIEEWQITGRVHHNPDAVTTAFDSLNTARST